MELLVYVLFAPIGRRLFPKSFDANNKHVGPLWQWVVIGLVALIPVVAFASLVYLTVAKYFPGYENHL